MGGTRVEESGELRLGDTWQWDDDERTWNLQAATWDEEDTSLSPGPRYGHIMSQTGDGHLLLFGGFFGFSGLPGVGSDQGDTWAWDGIFWERVFDEDPAGLSAPAPRQKAAFRPIGLGPSTGLKNGLFGQSWLIHTDFWPNS